MTKPAPAPTAPTTVTIAAERKAVATELMIAHRAEILHLDPATLAEREAVLGFGIVTRIKNFADRRVNAFRKRIDAIFTARGGMTPETQMLEHGETVFFDQGAHGGLSVRAMNGSFGKMVLSETKAFALLAGKKPSAKKMAMEQPLRPARPPARFSSEKFRNLVTIGVITQAEYDACLEQAPATTTVTIDVPIEIDAAITRMLIQRPPPDA